MQIQHKNRKPWTPEEKKIAFSIFYKSPSTYKYMRKNKITLPGESTMRRWFCKVLIILPVSQLSTCNRSNIKLHR